MARPRIDYSKMRHLPTTPEAAARQRPATLGIEALHEALAGGANDAARLAMANLIAKHGKKYAPEARKEAARIATLIAPLPPIPAYMLKETN